MGTKTKSFLSAVALGFGLLFLTPATSEADGRHSRGHHDRNRQHFRHDSRPHFRQYSRPRFRHYARPHHYGAYYRYHRPYRLVRVLVHDPFPRFVYRRVYDRPY